MSPFIYQSQLVFLYSKLVELEFDAFQLCLAPLELAVQPHILFFKEPNLAVLLIFQPFVPLFPTGGIPQNLFVFLLIKLISDPVFLELRLLIINYRLQFRFLGVIHRKESTHVPQLYLHIFLLFFSEIAFVNTFTAHHQDRIVLLIEHPFQLEIFVIFLLEFPFTSYQSIACHCPLLFDFFDFIFHSSFVVLQQLV